MKNIPRIFLNETMAPGKSIPVNKDIMHYLTRVMRTDECLVFNDGMEYSAKVLNSGLLILGLTDHPDPANDITFCFAPIKKTDEMLNMATQMGVAVLQPVITDRTVAHHVNWARMQKIIIEASEQSNRNSVPKLLQPQKFGEFLKEQGAGTRNRLVFADERFAHENKKPSSIIPHPSSILVGPEGGFSDAEFAALDAAGAVGISLGRTILRAETAAVAALAKLITNN